MRKYSPNSKEACARIVAMFMLADGVLEADELADETQEKIYRILSIERSTFLAILRDYLHDLRQAPDQEQSRISMLDPVRVNQLLEEVDEYSARIKVLMASLLVCKGDHALNSSEMALFRHVMNRWQIDLDDVINAGLS